MATRRSLHDVGGQLAYRLILGFLAIVDTSAESSGSLLDLVVEPHMDFRDARFAAGLDLAHAEGLTSVYAATLPRDLSCVRNTVAVGHSDGAVRQPLRSRRRPDGSPPESMVDSGLHHHSWIKF